MTRDHGHPVAQLSPGKNTNCELDLELADTCMHTALVQALTGT